MTLEFKKFIPEVEDMVENLGVPGIAAIVLLPVLVPVVAGKVGKPLAKATIKGGIVLYEKGKGVIAEVGENIEDIIAEAKAEIAEGQGGEAGAAEVEAAATQQKCKIENKERKNLDFAYFAQVFTDKLFCFIYGSD